MTRWMTLAAVLLAGCPADDDDDPNWRMALSDEDGAILSFWGNSKEDLFAVGGTLEMDGGQGRVLWHDGASWNRLPVTAPTLWWVQGFAHDDVWAVGEQGTILHYDGVDWTTVDSGHDYTLWGIWGASPDELWTVGGAITGGIPGVLRHYDGVSWTDVTGVGMADELFFKVWGTSSDNVYIVGDGGAIVHYDGSDWQRMDSGTTSRLLTVRGRSATDIYAVGGIIEDVLLHFDGTAWTQIDIADGDGLMGVWTAPGAPVITAGFRGFVVVGDDAGWREQPPLTYDCLHAVWGDDQGNYVLGGGSLVPVGPRTGVIIAAGDIANDSAQ